MTPSRVEKWVWILIYGGLLLASLGWFLQDESGVMGAGAMGLGGVMALTGIVLIWARSRMKT